MQALQYQFSSNVVPRLQWNANSGYCGETSVICAGLSFGQYCSQWTARALASPGMEQYEPGSQLLLGTGNDVAAANAMRLQAAEFSSSAQDDSHELIVWAKSRLLMGQVPIIGVFNNGIALREWNERDDGDPDYDHIVPVLGWASDWPLDEYSTSYFADDVITLSDNGLYGPCGSPPHYPFLFFYEAARFPGTRREANSPDGLPVYMLKNTHRNYGLVIEGIMDQDGACIPVRLSCNANQEPQPPEMPKDKVPVQTPPLTPPLADQQPTPAGIVLTPTVDLTGQTEDYNLYLYDDFDSVPTGSFNQLAANATQVWQVPAGTQPNVVINTTSDATVVFRAVPVSAP
jgi:hypothetical protein